MKLSDNLLKNISKKNIIILCVLLISILWINNILSQALNYNSLDLDPKVSNHFMKKFKMVETNADGNISWTMEGDKLEKFPNSPRSEVINPIMNVNSTETEKWVIRAKHALDPDSLFNSIYLTEDVVFNKYDENNNNGQQCGTDKSGTSTYYCNFSITRGERKCA